MVVPLGIVNRHSSIDISDLKRRKGEKAIAPYSPMFGLGIFSSVLLGILVHPIAAVLAGLGCLLSYCALRHYLGNRPDEALENQVVAEMQAERNMAQDEDLLRALRQFRASGRTDLARILEHFLRQKRRVESNIKFSGSGAHMLEIDHLVSEVADGVQSNLRIIAALERDLPAALLAPDGDALEALEESRADRVRQLRAAYLAMVEAEEALGASTRFSTSSPRGFAPNNSLPEAIESLRNEAKVAQRVREFLEEDLLLDAAESEFEPADLNPLEDQIRRT